MAHATTTAAVLDHRLKMTYEEFLDWLDEDETRHGEWVDGEVIVFTPTTVHHARALGFLYTLLSAYAQFRNLGEVLGPSLHMRVRAGRSSREPDLFFVAHHHRDRVLDTRLEGPADLVVELVSDDSVARDREAKFAEYASVGVPEYWIHDPRPGERRSDFFRLAPNGQYEPIPSDADGRVHSTVLSGFWLRPAWLRQDPLPSSFACLLEIVPDFFTDAARGSIALGE